MVKPRLYDGEEEASANLLWALERVLALLHPMMPFVTEEIWTYHPARRGHLAVHQFPVADESLFDPEAEAEVRAGIELTRRLRAWRDLVQAPAASVLPARAEGVEPQEFVGRLARFEFGEDGGEPVASVGPVRVLASDQIDADAVGARVEARREELRGEVARAEGKLANERFVANAPGRGRRGGAREARPLPRRAGGAVRISAEGPEAYLDSLEPIGWKLGLERMHRMNALLGMPQHRFASIHVVGTNGKSSVTRMTAALLEAHGVRRGRDGLAPSRALVGADPDRRRRDRAGGVLRGGREGRRGGRGRRAEHRGRAVTQFEVATAAGVRRPRRRPGRGRR